MAKKATDAEKKTSHVERLKAKSGRAGAAASAAASAAEDAKADENNEANVQSDVGANDDQARIAELELEVQALKDKLLRAVAETENLRKRSQKEVEDAGNFAINKFAKDLIAVLDNLYRAEESVPKEEVEADAKLKSFCDGVAMTKQEMISVFSRFGIERVDPKGEQFNHDFHQAIQQIESPEHESGVVIDVMQAGYTIKDRLLRPAMVIVAK